MSETNRANPKRSFEAYPRTSPFVRGKIAPVNLDMSRKCFLVLGCFSNFAFELVFQKSKRCGELENGKFSDLIEHCDSSNKAIEIWRFLEELY